MVLREAKPWQRRALEGSGGSRARFWTPAVLRGKVVTFVLEGRETVAEASSTGFWRYMGRAFGPPRFCVEGSSLLVSRREGRETVAEASSRELWR